MQYEHIKFEVQAGVATLTLNRPAVMNAVNRACAEEMLHAIDRVRDAGEARVLLLTATGRAFSAGADLSSDLSTPDKRADAGVLLERHFNPLIERMFALPVPVVSAVNGAAAGAGCSLALAGDLILASRSAYFLLAFVNIGLVPDAGLTWMLPRLVGRSRATEMMMLGERIDATCAEQWGLLHRTVEAEQLEPEARKLAERLARGPTKAYALMRQGLRSAMDGTLSETLAMERRHQLLASRTADFREGVSAFSGKRAPLFSGR